MKTNYVTVILIFSFFGIATNLTAQITLQEQETVKKEIREIAGKIFQNLEKMDAEALFQSYSNSPDFMFITTDGSMAGFQVAKNHHAALFKSQSSCLLLTQSQIV